MEPTQLIVIDLVSVIDTPGNTCVHSARLLLCSHGQAHPVRYA